MNFLALLRATLLLAPLPALALAPLAPPKQPVWEAILYSRFDVHERDQLVSLATLLPKIYGFRFICQFQSVTKGAAPVAVLPGEWIDTKDGGALKCPDHYLLELSGNTKLRVQQTDSTPRITLDHGQVRLTFGTDPLFLETAAYSVAVVGTGKSQQLWLSSNEKEQLLGCEAGVVNANFELREDAPGRKLLFANACRMDLSLNGSTLQRYIFSTDRVEAANLVLPHRYWPGLLDQPGPEHADIAARLYYFPTPSPTGKIQVDWTTNFPTEGMSCTLYGQKSEGDPLVEVGKFQPTATGGGRTEVDPAYSGGTLSFLCESASQTISSNATFSPTP
jgi:hypothetical protein